MPRPLRPIDPDAGPLARFAQDLRDLRAKAGGPTYRELAERTRFSLSAISDAARGDRLPSLDVTLAFVDACGGDRDAWAMRWSEVSAELAQAADGTRVDTQPPYRGLAPYEAEDADAFFGREQLLDELVARLQKSRFLAVLGPSGIGKSSVLRAGLLPAARAGRLPGTANATLITPGEHPLERLGTAGGLLVVDQFEEVFTACRSPGEQREFIDGLLRARGPDSDLRVVIGMRADFLGHCARHAELAAALSDATVLVGPMSADELRAVIVKPAARAGLSVDPALVATIVRDAGDEPGVLPLVSHALQETWRLRRGKYLSLAGYDAVSGLHGAVARTAERAYDRLSGPEREAARRVLLRMVVAGEGTEDTAQAVSRAQLPAADHGVVEQLVGARLLTRDGDSVRLAHEALLRSWPRLREWVADDRQGLRLHRKLTEAAAAWDELGRDPGALYRGTRLELAREWAPERELAPLERSFLEASVAAETAERTAAERRTRLLRTLVAVLAILLAVSVGTSALAWDRQQDALSRQLAAEALSSLRFDVGGAADLAVAAYDHAQTAEARGALLSLAGREPYHAKFTGHAGLVKAVAFSPDGRTLASAGQDRAVRLWDAGGGGLRSTLNGHTAPVRSVAFSPDGATIATADRAGKVLLWDAAAGTLVRTLDAHQGMVDGVAFSPDGRRLATAGQDHKAVVWDPGSGRRLLELPGYGGLATEVAYSPDGRTLAVAGDDGNLALWDVSQDVPGAVQVLPAGTGPLYAVAFSPDGKLLASAGEDRTITLWDAERQVPVAQLEEHTQSVRQLAFTDGGRTLVSAGYDHDAVLWDVRRGAPTAHLTGNAASVYGVAATADGRYVASAGQDETVLVWDRTLLPLTGHTDRVSDVAFSPDGHTLASGGGDGKLMLWDDPGGAGRVAAPRVVAAAAEGRYVYSVAYRPSGDLIATAGEDHLVRLWDPATGAPVATLAGHTDVASSAVFSPDGRLLVSAGLDGKVLLWDVTTRALLATLADGGTIIHHVTFSQDGRLLAATSDDGRVLLWDVGSRAALPPLPSRPDGVRDAAFSPDGRLLATAGSGGRVLLWDVGSRTVVAELPGHSAVVYAVAFSPDGRFLATGGLDHSVIVWDVATRTRWATLAGHDDVVASVAFSPDGRTLASGGGDRVVVLWTLDPQEARDRLRRAPTTPH